MKMIARRSIRAFVFFFLVIFGIGPAWSQNLTPSPSAAVQSPVQGLTLVDATLCEKIEAYKPHGRTIVISISMGKAICYSSFDPVPQKTVIYHNWYRSDVLTTSIKLELQPPRWATFSTIQLREADKGPWRVEIADKDGRIFQVLRFSITD